MNFRHLILCFTTLYALLFFIYAHSSQNSDLPSSQTLDNFIISELLPNVYCNQSAFDTGALSKVSGFAKIAGTSGGESVTPNIVYVKNYADSGPDSLRDAIQSAGNFSAGGVVRFMTHLNGDTIRLESAIIVPSNVSIDGSCVDISIEARADKEIFRIESANNIIIRNLELSQFGHNLSASDNTAFYDANSNYTFSNVSSDIITILSPTGQNWPDKIWISNNSFKNCGDECIGINMLAKDQDWALNPEQSNITISYNHFKNSRRAMLITSQACSLGSMGSLNPGAHIECDYFQNITSDGTAQQAEQILLNSPIKVTIEGNFYIGVENRMPIISYGVYVHSVGNLIIQRNLTGNSHSVYAVTDAGVLFSENNFILNSHFSGGPLQNISSVRIATPEINTHPTPRNAAAGKSISDVFSGGNIIESSFIDHDSDVNTPELPIWRYNNNSSYVADPTVTVGGYSVSKPNVMSTEIRDVMSCIMAVAGPDPLIDRNTCREF